MEKGQINVLQEEGYSNKEIAHRINRSAKVINNYVNDKENYGTHRRGGVKHATSERQRRRILGVASNSMLTAKAIANQTQTTCSIRTVQRVIKAAPHIKHLKIKRKSKLTPRHKAARLQFAQEHMAWARQWEQVIFTDEKKMNLDGSDGFRYYYHDLRKDEVILSRRHSSQGSIMIWGAISFNGTIDLTLMRGRQTAESYVELLNDQKTRITEVMGHPNWIFQQDNAPIHTARHVKNWFVANNITTLDWPALSPDLNLIENVWGWLTRRVYENGRQFDNAG